MATCHKTVAQKGFTIEYGAKIETLRSEGESEFNLSQKPVVE